MIYPTPPVARCRGRAAILFSLLLGGLLLDNTAWDRIGDAVSDADFYRDDHRRIFIHIRKLVETGRPADVVTVESFPSGS